MWTPAYDYLEHHGIEGQKWGHRNGPPYPLDYNDHSSSEKKKNPKSKLDNYDGGTGGKKPSKIKEFAKKHKKALIAGGTIAATVGGIAAYRYVNDKHHEKVNKLRLEAGDRYWKEVQKHWDPYINYLNGNIAHSPRGSEEQAFHLIERDKIRNRNFKDYGEFLDEVFDMKYSDLRTTVDNLRRRSDPQYTKRDRGVYDRYEFLRR